MMGNEIRRKITEITLNNAIYKHEKWLVKSQFGSCAKGRLFFSEKDFSNFCINGKNFSKGWFDNVNLSCSEISENFFVSCVLSGCNIKRSRIYNSIFDYSVIKGIDFRNTFFFSCSFKSSCIIDTDFSHCVFKNCYFENAIFRKVNFFGSKIENVKFTGVMSDEGTLFYRLQCPEIGSFIGYKRCGDYIIELDIPSEALRSSATTRVCRTNKAKVISITNLNGGESGLTSVPSNISKNFIYTVGETVRVDCFDEDRWKESSNGIHFFLRRDEAVNYF